MSSDPVVSVWIITYNHEAFIAKTIESAVNQKCNFKFEVVIGEDCSKDKTRQIVQEYASRYPDIIVPLFAEKNEGAKANAVKTMQHCRGKYIAFLEGDDYWTDLNKLQMQYDFLEANPEFSTCFTRVDVIDQAGNPAPDIYPPITKDEFGMEDIIMTERVFIPTATMFFRNAIPNPLPQFYVNAVSGDIAAHLLVSDLGKIKCLPGKTGAYRDHPGGITKREYTRSEYFKQLFILYVRANEYFNFKYNRIIRARLLQMSKTKLIYGSRDLKGFEKLKYVMQNSRDYFKYSDRVNIKEIMYYTSVLFFPSLLKLKK